MAISNVTDWDEIEADPDFSSLPQESRAKLFDDWEKKFSRTLLEDADLDKVKPEGLNRLAATNALRRRKLAGEDVSDPNTAAKTWSEQKQAEAKLAQQALKDYADVEDKKFRLDDARSMPGVDEFGRASPEWDRGVQDASKSLEAAEAKFTPEVRAQAQAASEALKGKRKIATMQGNIYTDPALVLNKEEFRQQVLDSDAPPEAKALKLASFQNEKKRYLDEAINTLTKGDPQIPLAESFPKFLESKGFNLNQEMAKQSEGKLDYSPIQKQRELAQEYLTKMQDRGWFRKIGSAISTGVATGMLDIGTQAVGTAAMATGDEETSKVAAELSRASGDIGAAQGLEGDMQATGGTFTGGLARLGTNMAPMLLPGGAVGGIARLAGAGAGAATAAAVGASALTAGAQTAGSQFGEVYDHLRQQGKTHEQAFGVSRNAAVLSGAVTTALTALGGATGVESLLRQGGKDLVKSRLVAAMKAVPGGAAAEIAEELPDEYVSQLVSAFAKDPNASPSQVTDEFAANAPDLILQIAALGGAGSGVSRFKETTTDPTKAGQPTPADDFAQRAAMEGATEYRAPEETAARADMRAAAEEEVKKGIPVEVEGVVIATIPPESDMTPEDVLDFANSPADMAMLARNGKITLPEVVAPVEGVDPAIIEEMNERVAASAALAPQTVEALKAAPAPEVQAETAEPTPLRGGEAAETPVAEPAEEVNPVEAETLGVRPPPEVDISEGAARNADIIRQAAARMAGTERGPRIGFLQPPPAVTTATETPSSTANAAGGSQGVQTEPAEGSIPTVTEDIVSTSDTPSTPVSPQGEAPTTATEGQPMPGGSSEWSPTVGQPATANINGQKVVGTVGPSTGKGLVSFQYVWNGQPQKATVRPDRLSSPVASLVDPPSYQYTQEQNTRKMAKHFPSALGVHANHDFRKSFASMAKDTSLSRIYRQMARELAKMPTFANMDLHVVADENQAYAGEYSFDNGKASIGVNLRQVGRGRVDALGTLLHEALHHVTLAKVRDPQGTWENEVLDKLDTIRGKVLEFAQQNGLGERFDYELGTVEEFISAVFTRPDFQNFLASIPDSFAPAVAVGKFRSILSEIFRRLAELVKGEMVAKGSTMEQAMTTVLALFETPFRAVETGKLEALNAVQSEAEEPLVSFLTDKTGSPTGQWDGVLTSAEQKKLFGFLLVGKAQVRINGESKTLKAKRSVGFGQDSDIQAIEFEDISKYGKRGRDIFGRQTKSTVSPEPGDKDSRLDNQGLVRSLPAEGVLAENDGRRTESGMGDAPEPESSQKATPFSVAGGYRTPADMLAEAAQKAKGEAVGTKPQGLASMFNPQAKRPATGERKLLDMPQTSNSTRTDSKLIANAYREAVRGSSTQMAPLSTVYAQARLLQPGLTEVDFLKMVQGGYDNGTLLLEGAGSQQEAAQAGLSLPGTPVGTAVRMMPAPQGTLKSKAEPDQRESDVVLGVMMEDGRFEEGVKMFDKAKRERLGAPPQPSANTSTPPRFTSPAQFAAAFESAFLRGDFDYFLEALKQADRHIYVPEMKRYINASKLGDTDAAERLEWFRHAVAGTIPANVKPQAKASAPPPAAVGAPTSPPPPTVTPPPKAGVSNRPMLTLNTPAMGLIAKMLGASIRINTLLRRARGRIKLSMADGSEIELSKHLFKDPVQAAKTLAHEIGHLFDFLPASGFTKTLAHKLAPLGDFRKVFGDDLADWFMGGGKKIKPSKITQLIKPELIALSKKWRGDFGPSDKYRGSGKELYADFISAILNDPMWTARNAPYATLGFLNALEQKPEVDQAYQMVVSLVQGGTLYKALAEADQGKSTTALERLIAKSSALMQAKKTLNDAARGLYRSMFGKWLPTAIRDGGIWKSYWNRLKDVGTSKDYNWAQEEASQFAVRQITQFDNDMAAAVGIPLKLAGIDPDYLQRLQTNNRIIHERRRVGKMIEEDPVKARQLLKWMVDSGLLGKDVQAEVDAAADEDLYALTAKVIGMTHANGDAFERALKAARRKGAPADAEKALYAFDVSGFMLNPKVLTLESAEADNADIEKTLGPDQFAELERINDGYHDLVKRTMTDAYKLGLFRKSTWEDVIEPNFGAYVPFTPIKYFTGHVKGGLGPARVGTAHDLMAPHVVGILKMHALIRRMQQQKQALLLLDFFNNTGLSNELEPVEDEDFDRIKAAELTKESKHTISYVPYWDEGEYKWVKVNGTDAVTLMQDSDPDDLAALYKVLRSNTQMWRLNFTIFSIAFNVANTLRNIATPFVDIGPKAGYKAAKQLLSVFPQMGKWVWAKMSGKDPASIVAASLALEHAIHKPGMPVSKELQEFYDRGILQPMPDVASLRMSQEELARSVMGAMSSPELLLQGVHKAAKDMKWYDNTLKQYLHSAVDVMGFIGSVSEAAPKIAAYQALKEKKDSKGKPAFTDAEASYLATLEGIPRPGVAGARNAALEMVLMFFRVAVQSWRKHLIMATAPQTRAGFLMRHMLFEGAKFGLQAMAANGAIDYLIALGAAAAAGGDDDDPEKYKQVDWAEAMDRQSSYKLSHGGIGPLLGWVLPDGSFEPPYGHKSIPADWVPIMPRLPGTELSREADPLSYYVTSKTMAPMIAPVNDDQFWNDFVRSVVPTLNPAFDVVSDAMSVLGPTPPRDSYRGREKVEQRIWDEGYVARILGLGEHHLKSFGIGSSPYDTKLPGVWNALKQPGVKTLLASDNMVGVRDEQRARREDDLTSSFAQNMVGEKFDKLKKTFNRLKGKATPRTKQEDREYEILKPVMSKVFYGTEKRDGKYDVIQSYARMKAKGLQDTPGGKLLKAKAEQATQDLEKIANDLQRPLEYIHTHTLP